MQVSKWNIEAETGYKPQTTFWEDFSIADRFGLDAIRDTYQRSMESWKTNHIYLTELVMVLNWKCWQHNSIDGHQAFMELYSDLFYECREYALDHLTGEELNYFLRTTD